MSDKKKDKAAEAKAKKGKKNKKGEAPAGGNGNSVVMSVASHPRASASVRRAKGWGGLAAFGVTAYLSLSHGVALEVAGARALAAGVFGYVVAWACTVMIWRQLMVAELRARVERVREQSEPRAPAAGAETGGADVAPARS